MNEELKKSLVGMFLDGIISIGDVIDDSYKAGFKEAIDKACKWLDRNLEYYLGDYNLASHDFEANQPLYGKLIDELRKHMNL